MNMFQVSGGPFGQTISPSLYVDLEKDETASFVKESLWHVFQKINCGHIDLQFSQTSQISYLHLQVTWKRVVWSFKSPQNLSTPLRGDPGIPPLKVVDPFTFSPAFFLDKKERKGDYLEDWLPASK